MGSVLSKLNPVRLGRLVYRLVARLITQRVFLLLVKICGSVWLAFAVYRRYFSQYRGHDFDQQILKKEYDFIVVGSGSGGACVAARLSENPKHRVLLLEAGRDDDVLHARVPAGALKLQREPDRDWGYRSEPQSNACFGMNNNESAWPRGKLLGGCSTINYMLFVRGNKRDYDYWAKEMGCPGWDFASMLPYFKRMESVEPRVVEVNGDALRLKKDAQREAKKSNDTLTKEIDRFRNVSFPWRQPSTAGKRGTYQTQRLDGTGPLNVSVVNEPHPQSANFIKAAQHTGIPYNPDYNGESQIGVGWSQVSLKNGQRYSSSFGYLRRCYKRPNLDVATKCHVTRVVFDKPKRGQKPRAIGVAFRRGNYTTKPYNWLTSLIRTVAGYSMTRLGVGPDTQKDLLGSPLASTSEQFVRVKRATGESKGQAGEVILSAGAVGSPQILMLSGVGPKEHLAEVGVSCVVDRPGVGNNLQDHLFVPCMRQSLHPQPTSSEARCNRLPNVAQYGVRGTGVLTSQQVEALAFIKTPLRKDFPLPDLQLHFVQATGGVDEFDCFNMKREHSEALAAHLQDGDKSAVAIFPSLLHPKSIGYIRLKSANPLHHPVIQPNYLSDPDDIRLLVAGCRYADLIFNQPPFSAGDLKVKKEGGSTSGGRGTVGQDLSRVLLPNNPFDKDRQPNQYWDFYVRHMTLTIYHPVGTCSMGPTSQKSSVVDTECRVIGTSGLRVVDASVMPLLPSGNTHAPVVAVAERAADLIRADHGDVEARRRIMSGGRAVEAGSQSSGASFSQDSSQAQASKSALKADGRNKL